MKLPEKHKIVLLKQILNRIEKSEGEIDQIIEQIKNEININELNESLSKDFNLDFFGDIVMQFSQFQNISELAKNIKNLKIDQSKISNSETLHKFLSHRDDPTLRLSLLLKTDVSNKSKREVYNLLQKLFTINKEQLCQEFDFNKRTLNKWLKYFFEQKYSGNRKIYLNDYLTIFKAFYFTENEKINDLSLETVRKRIIKGSSYLKKDIALYVDSNLTIQKKNVETLEFYNLADKFPYSLAQKIATKMGGSL